MFNFICGFSVEVTAHILLIKSTRKICEDSVRQKNMLRLGASEKRRFLPHFGSGLQGLQGHRLNYAYSPFNLQCSSFKFIKLFSLEFKYYLFVNLKD